MRMRAEFWGVRSWSLPAMVGAVQRGGWCDVEWPRRAPFMSALPKRKWSASLIGTYRKLQEAKARRLPNKRKLRADLVFSLAPPESLQHLSQLAPMARVIVHNAKITTLAAAQPSATALAVGSDGNFVYVGEDTPALWAHKGPSTIVIDLKGRRLLPGLNDSHLHILRAALWYNGELRWDGVTSLKRGLDMLSEQAKRTPEGQWVRVVGGWTHYQFEEKVRPRDRVTHPTT